MDTIETSVKDATSMLRPTVLYLEKYGVTNRLNWLEARCNLVYDEEHLKGRRRVVYITSFILDELEKNIEQTKHLIDSVDAYIVNCGEFHELILELIQKYDHPNITWFVPGAANIELKSTIINNSAWFEMTAEKYLSIPKLNAALASLNPYDLKPNYFDVLLGMQKPHRDLIYRYMQDNKLQDRNILRYIYDTEGLRKVTENHALDFTERLADGMRSDIDNTVDFPIPEYGSVSFSQIIPNRIYHTSAYSMVAESVYDSQHVNFYTEKTFKPILAKRMFIIASNKHHLKNLKNLGFKTFDVIVDESYDEIDDHEERWTAACEQMKNICDHEQELVLRIVRPIVEHNYRHLMTGGYLKQYIDEFERLVLGT